MFRLLIIFGAGFLLYKLFLGDKKKKQEDQIHRQSSNVASGELVKDPVCGTYVSVDSDIRVREGNRVYCFCSYDCRDKFLSKKKG